MSMDDAQAFLRRLAEDPELAAEAAAACRRSMVELAGQKGFTITEEDLTTATRGQDDGPDQTIDDPSLDAVVGGVENPVSDYLWGKDH